MSFLMQVEIFMFPYMPKHFEYHIMRIQVLFKPYGESWYLLLAFCGQWFQHWFSFQHFWRVVRVCPNFFLISQRLAWTLGSRIHTSSVLKVLYATKDQIHVCTVWGLSPGVHKLYGAISPLHSITSSYFFLSFYFLVIQPETTYFHACTISGDSGRSKTEKALGFSPILLAPQLR